MGGARRYVDRDDRALLVVKARVADALDDGDRPGAELGQAGKPADS